MGGLEANRLETEKEKEVRRYQMGEQAKRQTKEFSERDKPGMGTSGNQKKNIEFLLDIPLEISVELGRTKMTINDLLKLSQGSVIELSKFAGETLDVLANQQLIARGEVAVANEKYAIRLTEVASPAERIERLK